MNEPKDNDNVCVGRFASGDRLWVRSGNNPNVHFVVHVQYVQKKTLNTQFMENCNAFLIFTNFGCMCATSLKVCVLINLI